MKEIIMNVNKLSDDEMTDFTTKVKLLLVNSKNELLLGYSHHEYQFPGGTQETNELLVDTVKRELMEETGILLNFSSVEPFAKFSGYYKDWPELGRNKKVEIYYYEIKTDEKPHLDKLNLTESEKEGNFELRYVPLDIVEDELNNNISNYGDPHGIAKEMINILNVYKRDSFVSYDIADKKDIEQLAKLRIKLLEYYNNDLNGLKDKLYDDTVTFLNKKLNDNMFYYVARIGNEIVATCCLTIEYHLPKPSNLSGIVGKIGQVYTKEEYRRKGIQKKIFDKTLSLSKDKGCNKVYLGAVNPNAIKLYKKFGFKEVNDKFELHFK